MNHKKLICAIAILASFTLVNMHTLTCLAAEPEWDNIYQCVRNFYKNEAKIRQEMKIIKRKVKNGEIVFQDTKPGPEFRRMGHCDDYISTKWWVTH